MTEFDVVKTYTGGSRLERGWLNRENVVGNVSIGTAWRCKTCKEYFTTEDAKHHNHKKGT
jgi:hypothetical protein